MIYYEAVEILFAGLKPIISQSAGNIAKKYAFFYWGSTFK